MLQGAVARLVEQPRLSHAGCTFDDQRLSRAAPYRPRCSLEAFRLVLALE
jgi:hypothetical protein